MEREISADRFETALKELRADKFAQNLPFLILSGKLPDGQAYYEYQDGRIEIRRNVIDGGKYTTELVRELNTVEAYKVRREK